MSLTDFLVSRLGPLRRRLAQLNDMTRRLDDLQMAVGRIERRLALPPAETSSPLHRYEFKVYSQWGEDGIIQYLTHAVPIPNPVFVEFGVQDYREANTRFLLQHDNWCGLIMDASRDCMEAVRRDPLFYRHTLQAVTAFIDRENINTLLRENGITGDIGLLSIDIDGNDYWIWDAIECIAPRIVVCEYDTLLGPDRKVTTPYDPAFDRLKAHYSFLYGGASIAALEHLARRKGYALVGSNSAGNNAFFVREDVRGDIPTVTPRQAYVQGRFRHSRDEQGRFTFLPFAQCRELIAALPVVDVERNITIPLREVFAASSPTT